MEWRETCTHCCVSTLVHDDCYTEAVLFCEDALEQGGFSCAEETADDGEGNAARLFILLRGYWDLVGVLNENWNLVVVHIGEKFGKTQQLT
jgi:hypothetical protein